MKFQQIHLRLDKETYEKIKIISKENKESVSEVVRQLINEGLAVKVTEENTDIIAATVRKQLEVVLNPHINRLASLSSKSGHMAATAAFLNVQALMDLVPKENRKNVREMYENARKKSAEYMRKKTKDWEGFEDE